MILVYIYIWLNNIDILSTNFYIYRFKLPYRCYDIRPELVNKLSIINWFPSTFYAILCYHQRVCVLQAMYITFACTSLWRRIQPLAGMSNSLWQFSPKSNRTAPFVELKEPPLFATLWIFLSEQRHSSFLRSVQFGWNLRRKQNRCLWRK